MIIGIKALKLNPALKPFERIIGEWETTGSHPLVPNTILHGRTSIGWLEGGAFVIIRSEIDHPEFPQGVEIIGSDNAENTLYMLHFDERGVSRKYDVEFKDNELTWRRDDPVFSQRYKLVIESDGSKMESKGEMSRNGGAWEGDLELVYDRFKD